MKSVTSAYLNAVKDYGREWQNQVVIRNGNLTESYTNADITIEEVMSENDNLSMGKAFTKELKLKLKEPLKTLSYNNATIEVISRLKVNGSYSNVKMGTFFPSKVETSDDYATLDITAYDFMAKLEEEYEPNVTLPTTDTEILEDICNQYGIPSSSYGSYDLIGHQIFPHLNEEARFNTYGYSFKTTSPKAIYENDNYEIEYSGNGCSIIGTSTNSGDSVVAFDYDNINLTQGDLWLLLISYKAPSTSNSLSSVTFRYGVPFTSTMTGFTGSYKSVSNSGSSETIVKDGNWHETHMLFTISQNLVGASFRIEFPGMKNNTEIEVKNLMAVKLNALPISGITTYNRFRQNYTEDYYEYKYRLGTGFEISSICKGSVKEQLGWLAGLQGKNAVFDYNNKLAFRWYSSPQGANAQTWSDYTNIAWQNINGTWSSFDSTAQVDRASQKENGLKLNEGSFQIQSITSGTEETQFTTGTGKGISFYNPYITRELVYDIGLMYLGSTYKVGSVDTFGNPAFEVGDILSVIDKNGNPNAFYLSHITWNFSGGCNSTYQSVGNADATIEFETPTEKTILTKATTLQDMIKSETEYIKGAKGGIFRLTDSDNDGINDGTIWAETTSQVMTPTTKCMIGNYQGLGLSEDGGATLSTGIDHNGIWGKKGVIGGWTIANNSLYADRSNIDGYDWRTYLQPVMSGSGYGGNTWVYSIQRRQVGTEDYHSTFRATANGDLDTWGDISSKDGNNRTRCRLESSNGNIKAYDSDGKLRAYLEGNTGNVFAKDSNEQVRSYLSGDGKIRAINSSGVVTCWLDGNNGNVCGNSFVPTSLAEKKENFENVENALSLVNGTDIYKYDLKNEAELENRKKHFGAVIGEDFNCADEIIAKDIDGSPQGIDLYSMCSILWKAVQELSQEVESLKQQLEEGGN